MIEQEIFEYNKLCAEFLGWKIIDGIITYIPEKNNFQHEVGYSAKGFLQFHSDWNWIEEILNAIESKGFSYILKSDIYDNKRMYTLKFYDKVGDLIFISCKEKKYSDKKKAVVFAIYQFLKWYKNEEVQVNKFQN